MEISPRLAPFRCAQRYRRETPRHAARPGAQHQGVLDRLAQQVELELEDASLDGGQQLGRWVRAKGRQSLRQIEDAEPDRKGRFACSYELHGRGTGR
jgi:hypothetical protein